MKRFISATLILLLILLAGCGTASDLSPEAAAIRGKWAYNHDEETVVLELKSNGKAVFHGDAYRYDCDDEYVILTDSDGGELRLRYILDGEELYIYEHTTYKYTGEGSPDGLVGVWSCEESNWEFEFTESGTFMEDGYFPGYYTVDEANGSFKLIYNDQFEDAVCYYEIVGNELLLEYPWCMVKAK